MKILFLDIDGVLNDRTWAELCESKTEPGELPPWHRVPFPKHIVDNLHLILNAIPDLKIVVSSSWRVRHNKGIFRILNNLAGIPEDFFIDITPIRKDSRGDEINEWLEKNKDIDKFVILDDDVFDIKKEQMQFLVMPDYTIGLTEENAKQVINKLS
jgi:hypothetical protein